MEKRKVIPVPAETRKEIQTLVKKFSDRPESFEHPDFQEESLRVEFINPFFKALGWDVENKQNLPETLKPVIHIYSQKAGGTTRRPDYAFRYGRDKKFFLEAKKPAVDIFSEKRPAYQARLYSYNERLPITILTNFKQFAVYDYRITKDRPSPDDRPEKGRREFFTFEQYLDNLEFLYSAFSYEAAKQLNFDLYVEEKPIVLKISVDEDFLNTIEAWRKKLALDIARNNTRLSNYEVNYAVQATIDRIIFLRMAEDRGIEREAQLQSLINGANVYKRLFQLFQNCDDKYNSGLFNFKADETSPKLKIQDKTLTEIVDSLYGDDCPYIFSSWDADILGSVYERFLEKVIHLTPTHQARVEEKPEVKKAKGVYYTPKYIVDYIVKNTVGRLLSADKSVRSTNTKTVGAFKLTRRYLPHLQLGGSFYFVTFASARGELSEPARRALMDVIKYDDGKKYELVMAVVMPDHAHILLKPLEKRPGEWFDLAQIAKLIKGVSSRRINELLGSSGRVWKDDRYDKVVRDQDEFDVKIEYMLQNPVKAGLADKPENYKFFVFGKSENILRGADTLGGTQTDLHAADTLVSGLSPKQISNIKILDPACGSGSFLIAAYQYLLDYHLDYYAKNEPQKHEKEKRIMLGPENSAALTIQEKKRILLNNIYGVDIDPQAVEVTKLSLLLKVLENEDQETLRYQMKLFHKERALPDLDQNIKCGNSLIGPDFYQNQQKSFFENDDEKRKINAFDWHSEFKDIFKPVRGADTLVGTQPVRPSNPGFDVVIGNPPWGGDIDRYLSYFHEKYPSTTHEHTDSFKLFIEQAINLLRSNRLGSMIVPNTILRQKRLKDVRGLLMKYCINSLVDLGENVFKGVVAPSCIFVVEKIQLKPTHQVSIVNLTKLPNSQKAEILARRGTIGDSMKQATFENNADLAFVSKGKEYSVNVVLLGEFTDLKCRDAGINYQRVGTGMQDKGKSDLADRLLYEGRRQKERDQMYWKGSDIGRYWIEESTSRFCRTNYKDFIRSNEVVILNKEVYETSPKILFRQTADRILATIDYKGVWFGRSIIAILPRPLSSHKLEYFLGILNSTYFEFLYNSLAQEEGRVFAQVKLAKVKQLPIRIIDFSNTTDKTRHDKMVQLVGSMLSLHKKLSSAKTPYDKSRLESEIKATDNQIDKLVYELYGLSEEEIRIVEQGG